MGVHRIGGEFGVPFPDGFEDGEVFVRRLGWLPGYVQEDFPGFGQQFGAYIGDHDKRFIVRGAGDFLVELDARLQSVAAPFDVGVHFEDDGIDLA
jgi:hypothetical protein